jgi:hypothetical protein
MKEYLRLDGEGVTVSYGAPVGTTSVTYVAVDADTGDSVQSGSATSLGSLNFSVFFDETKVAYDRNLKITFTNIAAGGSNTDVFFASIVRPYADPSKIASELGLTIVSSVTDSFTQITQAKIESWERLARLYINSFTSDRFNVKRQKQEVFGQDSDVLYFSERVWNVYKIWEDDAVVYDQTVVPAVNLFDYPLEINSTNHMVKALVNGNTDVINEYSDYSKAVLSDPGIFAKHSKYKVDGEFGWKYVPQEIEMATILLANEYMCSDNVYKNRKVSAIQTDAYSVRYSESAFVGSGNTIIDSLLMPFKRIDLGVI